MNILLIPARKQAPFRVQTGCTNRAGANIRPAPGHISLVFPSAAWFEGAGFVIDNNKAVVFQPSHKVYNALYGHLINLEVAPVSTSRASQGSTGGLQTASKPA